MVELSQIRAKLAEGLKTSGLTYAEIARKIGVKHQQVSCYANGKKMPALDTFANLCAVLDLDANEILCINNKSPL